MNRLEMKLKNSDSERMFIKYDGLSIKSKFNFKINS